MPALRIGSIDDPAWKNEVPLPDRPIERKDHKLVQKLTADTKWLLVSSTTAVILGFSLLLQMNHQHGTLQRLSALPALLLSMTSVGLFSQRRLILRHAAQLLDLASSLSRTGFWI